MAPTNKLYGNHKYSSITYGSGTIQKTRFGLTVDWNRDGYFSGRNEAKRLENFTLRRGRKYYIKRDGSGFEQEDVGTFKAVIADPNEEFNPYNAASPLYGQLGPNRRMAMTALTPNGVNNPLFAGTLSNPIFLPGTINKVRLEAQDGWQILQSQKARVTIQLQENIFADDALGLILTKTGWPSAWGSDLNTGLDQQPYYFVPRQSAAQAIFDLVHSELGRVFIKNSGALAFRNRYFLEIPVATFTDQSYIYDSLDVTSPWEVMRNVVSIKVRPRTLQTSSDLWALPSPLPINAGEVKEIFADLTYNNEDAPAKNLLGPTGGIDYSANTAEDGSGTDLTGSITVTRQELGLTVKNIVTNTSGSNGWLRVLKVRGQAVAVTSVVGLNAEDIGVYDDISEFTLDVPWIQNVARAEGFRDFMLSFLKTQKQYVTFTLKPTPGLPNTQFALDLGRYVRLDFDQLGLDANFSIAQIQHEYEAYNDWTMTTLVCEPLPDVSGYWQFGISAFGLTTKFAL